MKIKKQPPKTMSAKPQEIPEVETDAVEAILDVEKALKSVVIGRSREARGLILSIISEQHMMMEGEPGIAKTMLATEFAHRVTGEDFNFFKTQLSRGMVSDQLLGPTNIMKLRSEAVYEYNTKGMLPHAHVAVLDEVYRGPEMLLPVILSILNEREFHNGSHIDKCPLITAIGTTNFTTDTDELKAFHDRWLVNCAVARLTSSEDRLTMLVGSLSNSAKLNATISLDQIRELHALRREVKVSKVILQLYDQLALRLVNGGKGKLRFNISDRRLVLALRLAQAAAVLRKSNEVTPDDLVSTEYGLIVKGLTPEENEFSTAYQAEIGQYQKLQQEEAELATLRELRNKWYNKYDEKLPKERLEKLQTQLRAGINEARGKTYSSQANQAEFNRIFRDYEQLLASVASDLQGV